MNRFVQLTTRYKHNMDFNDELLDETLQNTMGQSEMSDKDTKMAVLALKGVVEYQGLLLHDVIELLAEEPKPKFWQFWK